MASPIHAETDDTVSALVQHESHRGDTVQGTVHVSWSVPECATEATEIMVEGSNGWLWIEDNIIRLYLHKKPSTLPGWSGIDFQQGWNNFTRNELPTRAAFNMSPEYGGEGYANEIADFVRAINSKSACRFNAHHGLDLQRAVDAYYRSAEIGGSMILCEND